MPCIARVAIHSSQFPEAVQRDLIESLRTRRINPKFHYDSVKQTAKWLALHRTHSPSRTDDDCAAAYDAGFKAAVARISERRVHLIGLGCGGGQKDTRLLTLLKGAKHDLAYTPCDVSTAMVLAARQTALAVLGQEDCHPFVCDLATAGDLPAIFEGQSASGSARLFTFFGMIPNFEPEVILPKLARLVQGNALLLFSANLAPGPDYAAGVQRVLPQYDNPLTRDWLMTFLLDLGFEKADGELRFGVEDYPAGSGLKRIAADFKIARKQTIEIHSERFEFLPGESIRLFFSYRHTAASAEMLLRAQNLRVLESWLARSAEEGIFLVCHE